jgi:hypothetical protein
VHFLRDLRGHVRTSARARCRTSRRLSRGERNVRLGTARGSPPHGVATDVGDGFSAGDVT